MEIWTAFLDGSESFLKNIARIAWNTDSIQIYNFLNFRSFKYLPILNFAIQNG